MFFDHLVADRRQQSYYLVILVYSPNYKGRAIIKNVSLLWFLYKTQRLPEEEYQTFAKRLLAEGGSLKTRTPNIERWGFRRLKRNGFVDEIAAMGREKFLKHYFGGETGRVIKPGLSDDEKNAIIEKLFDWSIATSNEEPSGLLYYTEFNEGTAFFNLRRPPDERIVTEPLDKTLQLPQSDLLEVRYRV